MTRWDSRWMGDAVPVGDAVSVVVAFVAPTQPESNKSPQALTRTDLAALMAGPPD